MRCPSGIREEAFAEQLRRQRGVLAAEPDRLHRIQVGPNDPLYGQQWHLPRVQAEAAWSLSPRSSSVVIAILDTGVDPNHPDLASRLEPGWNALDETAPPLDDNGHGTAVAGVAAAATNNATGVASLAWGCRILPVKVADASGWASTSNLYLGLLWAADRGARVANLSFRVSENTFVSFGMQYFASKGGVVTVSAGNQGEVSGAPDNPHCLTVGATDSNDWVTAWSNRGEIVDLTAPGDRVLTTNRGGGYGLWTGTSFSAPLVAAAAALVLGAKPDLTSEQAMRAVREGAVDLGQAGWDPEYGQGRLDAAAALRAVADGPPKDETPPSVEFLRPSPGSTVEGSVEVAVRAIDDRGVRSVSLWLDGDLLSEAEDADGLVALWNTLLASNGTHELVANAEDHAGNVGRAAIWVEVANGDRTPPTVVLTAPLPGGTFSDRLAVRGYATDASGVARIEVYVNSSMKGYRLKDSFTMDLYSRYWRPGLYTVRLRAYDKAGNVSETAPITVQKL
ncbi:MAG: S8 family serine peptidase [Fimbriimonadales bacterium]